MSVRKLSLGEMSRHLSVRRVAVFLFIPKMQTCSEGIVKFFSVTLFFATGSSELKSILGAVQIFGNLVPKKLLLVPQNSSESKLIFRSFLPHVRQLQVRTEAELNILLFTILGALSN